MIDREVISTVFHEERYNEAAFLEPSDFECKDCDFLWSIIQKFKGDTVKMLASMDKQTRIKYLDVVQSAFLGVGIENVSYMGLYILERKFKTLFKSLLNQLITKSSRDVEKTLLSEIVKSVDSQDIFDVSDHAIDYLGAHATDSTRKRINDFLNYRQKRIDKIKTMQDELQ